MGEVHHCQIWLLKVGQLAGEPIIIQPQLDQLGHSHQRGRDRPRELVAGQHHLLERPHMIERVARNDTGKVVPGKIDRPQGAQLGDVGHRPSEDVAAHTQGAQLVQAQKCVDVDETHEAHVF